MQKNITHIDVKVQVISAQSKQFYMIILSVLTNSFLTPSPWSAESNNKLTLSQNKFQLHFSEYRALCTLKLHTYSSDIYFAISYSVLSSLIRFWKRRLFRSLHKEEKPMPFHAADIGARHILQWFITYEWGSKAITLTFKLLLCLCYPHIIWTLKYFI